MRTGSPAPAAATPSRHPPYRTPDVTREWPADEPSDPVDWPVAILMAVALLAAVTFVVVHAALHPHLDVPTGPAIASLAALMLLIGLADQACDRLLPPEARALRRARRALLLGEEPHVTAGRVRGLALHGRAASCRDRAARCLVEAGKCQRLEERLRREAVRWLGRALDELFKDVR